MTNLTALESPTMERSQQRLRYNEANSRWYQGILTLNQCQADIQVEWQGGKIHQVMMIFDTPGLLMIRETLRPLCHQYAMHPHTTEPNYPLLQALCHTPAPANVGASTKPVSFWAWLANKCRTIWRSLCRACAYLGYKLGMQRTPRRQKPGAFAAMHAQGAGVPPQSPSLSS